MHWVSKIPLQHHPKFADIRYLSAQFQLHPLLTQHLYNQGFLTLKTRCFDLSKTNKHV